MINKGDVVNGKKYISLREVGRRLDIPPSTVVYYKDKFAKYIPSEGGGGRRRRYPVEVLEIIRRVREMFNDNWSTEQIERELALKFSVLMNDQQSDRSVDQSSAHDGSDRFAREVGACSPRCRTYCRISPCSEARFAHCSMRCPLCGMSTVRPRRGIRLELQQWKRKYPH